MNCPACGRDNRAEARFCSGCAAPLQPDCPSCGARNEPGARFCDQCATPLAGEPPAPRGPLRPESAPRAYTPKHLTDRILQSKSAIEGERKHVTVLFVDIAGYTSLSERLDPEQVHALMDRCFRHILEEVHRYEGTVNQFTGDGVMALFGAPIALEGAPRRAIMAALGMQRSLESLRQEMLAEGGPDVRMRVGIHSGPVVVGRIGDDLRMDYTAVGDTTNLADRLQRLAPPGSIYISEATEHLVSGFFDLVDLGPQRVKGKAEPVHAFEVVGERAVRGRIEATADAGLTPLVGRGRELDLLWSAFESARAGNGQVAFLVGEAGIGKSRLLSEFRRKLGDEPHTWIEGRCTSYGEHTAFYAIIDALRRRFGLEDKDGEATALAKVQEAQEAVGGDLDWTLPFVRSLLSLPAGDRAVAEMDAVTRRSETVRALHARILRAAERNPLIFVVEDLHWIDAASEEFLTFLADSIPAMRVLLVFAHRPGYQHPFGDRSYHTRISLQPLSASEMADMADSILETSTLPDEVRGLITSKAEGNPFFVEEVTKSLLEEGVLHLEQGRVEVAGPVEDVSVPDSITDVLMARIDRLPDEPKRAIQVASVIGREFALRLLERISEAGDRVSAVVEDLRALELILQKSAYPELAFMFKHALTCDVAYESVLLQRRKTLHRIVGAAIEELYRDRLVEHLDALAYHFTLGEEWERAFEYHDRASEKAADAFANHAAAEHCRQALAVAEHLAEAVPDAKRLRLEERLGKACWCVNRFAASGDAYLRAADLAAEPAVRATNLGRAANSLIWGHDYDRARTTTDEALTLARAIHSPAAEAVGLSCRYEQSMVEGETQAGHLVNEAAPLAERSGDAEAIVFALVQQAQYAEWHGTYGAAVSIAERACTLARSEQLTHLALQPNWILGKALCCLGEYGRALSVLREGLELSDRVGDRAFKTRLLNTLGWCCSELGSHERASQYNHESAILASKMVELELVPGAPELYANAAVNLAGNRIALGDLDGAMEHLEPIQADLDRPGDPWMRWRYSLHVQDGLARVALARGDPERALPLIDAELEGARTHRARKLEARALELRGRALVASERPREAQETLERALEVARKLEYPPVVWRATSLLAVLAQRSGNRSDAERLAAQAQGLPEGLAGSLPEAELERDLRALAGRLAEDPLGAYR
jgi:class 3 adenylate cyclase/tetratricopeptide (TPR) repeat protein